MSFMARVALPQSKIRARRKKRRIRIAIVVFATLFILFAAVAGASWIPAVRISEIRVQGLEISSGDVVRDFVRSQLAGTIHGVFPKNSVFLYPKSDVVEKLQAQFPALHSVRLRANVPTSFDSITVSLAERDPRALWCGADLEEPCSFMDEVGVVYAFAPEFSDAVYIKYYGATLDLEKPGKFPKQFLTPAQFKSISALAIELAKEVGPIERVSVDAKNDARISFGNGFDLLFSVKDDGGDIFQRFILAGEAEPFKNRSISDFQYLDLRFGDKLYYKLKAE